MSLLMMGGDMTGKLVIPLIKEVSATLLPTL
jgi:hypothetical protein